MKQKENSPTDITLAIATLHGNMTFRMFTGYPEAYQDKRLDQKGEFSAEHMQKDWELKNGKQHWHGQDKKEDNKI